MGERERGRYVERETVCLRDKDRDKTKWVEKGRKGETGKMSL